MWSKCCYWGFVLLSVRVALCWAQWHKFSFLHTDAVKGDGWKKQNNQLLYFLSLRALCCRTMYRTGISQLTARTTRPLLLNIYVCKKIKNKVNWSMTATGLERLDWLSCKKEINRSINPSETGKHKAGETQNKAAGHPAHFSCYHLYHRKHSPEVRLRDRWGQANSSHLQLHCTGTPASQSISIRLTESKWMS